MDDLRNDRDQTIFVAGHRGMVGSAIVRCLEAQGCGRILTANRQSLDLTDQAAVRQFFADNRINQVYLAAAKVGGIHANNTYPAEFIHDNLVIQTNIIHAAHTSGVDRLLFLGSSCIYPKLAEQPMREDALLTGVLEPTNEPYAIAKIAGIKMCESYNRQYGRRYRSVMPTNLYGPNDNFHPDNAHVLPALMRRLHEAKAAGRDSVAVWGTGRAMREFLHVDDMARASVFVMRMDDAVYANNTRPTLSHINVGTGQDCTIGELVHTLARVIGYEGRLEFDASKPEGAPRKLMDVSRLNAMGWRPEISLEDGLRQTYGWFLENSITLRAS
ncbi:GDP-L-fucose synthase [Methylobacterium sp. GC_Met_2]|uniref:GDP-L-fucose synthase n=1 Tax=Methylobacterium sp. GC_Met_2 TaxID=2937376 RepID=UPI00226B6208|nr:GDP-L-fucose synthase [Methylobacterium sp. GC_Met_2]